MHSRFLNDEMRFDVSCFINLLLQQICHFATVVSVGFSLGSILPLDVVLLGHGNLVMLFSSNTTWSDAIVVIFIASS